MSSDEEVVCVRKKKVIVADSSDDNEIVDKEDVQVHDAVSNNEEAGSGSKDENNSKKKKRRVKTFDSSSDSEDSSLSDDLTQMNQSLNMLKKAENTDKKGFPKESGEFSKHSNDTSDENEELINREIDTNDQALSLGRKTVCKNLWYNNTDLYDAEGSSEEEEDRRGEEANAMTYDNENLLEFKTTPANEKPKQQKKLVKGTERKSKTKAQEDIKTDIHRESQRLMRQVPISIPYHRPKQRSLAEFLVRRKSTPNVPLHASSEQLVNALRGLEQREKEAELFYMSESSEDDSEIKKEQKNSENNFADGVFTENPQILEKTEQTLNTDSVVHTDSQEINYVQIEDMRSTEKPDSEDCHTEPFFLNSNNTSKCENELSSESIEKIHNVEKQNSVDEKTEVTILKPTGETKTLDDELCNTNSEEKLQIQKYLHTSPIQTSEQTQSNVDCNSLANTEEFSLKLSESQSDIESIENRSFQNTSQQANSEINVDCHVNNSAIKDSSTADKSDKIKDPGDKTGERNCQIYEVERENNGQGRLGLSCREIDVENELYKKYNVELKNTTISTPKIIGSHDEIIDLSEGVPKPEVDQLMKRFLIHLSYKKKQNKKVPVELSIVSTETDAAGHVSAINEESVQVLVGEGEEEEEDPNMARPGAKLARLRAQLQQQMERQRDQEWTKRLQEQRLYEDEEVYEGEKEVCDGNEDEIEKAVSDEDKDETEEEEEEDEEESENEEDETDEEVTEKKRKSRSIFLDDEAEESDEEPYTKRSYTKNHDNTNDNNDDGDDSNESTVDNDHHDEESNNEKTKESNNQNPEKRDDNKGSGDVSDFFVKRPAKIKPVLPRTRTASDMFSSEEVQVSFGTDDEELPSFQKQRSVDDKEDVEEKLPEIPSIISPTFQLTALENMDVTNKYNWSAPSTPCKDFLSPKTVTPVRAIPNLVDKSPQICTQDLENMCSGQFTSQPIQDTEENAQDFELFLTEDSRLVTDQVTPMKSSSTSRKTKSSGEEQIETLLLDDEDEPAARNLAKNKKAKKLNFSDDEDDGDDRQETEVDAVMDGSDREDSDEESVSNDKVEYDSEENEVEVARGGTAGEFLDVEAELSEEEWSSEDEDERGLDTLEMEEADKEKIDQRRLQRELNQIHMKELLKEDKKQVKLLQEMLLEDGELHSENKRQRLFRWSNNAAFGEGDNKAVLDSDEEKAEEDEDEENWRKSRHERELFLQEHSKKEERLETLELEESDSQLLRLGHKALKRLNSNSKEPRLTPPTLSNPLASPDAKKPFALPKRGSFLSRGQQALTRLAQMVASTSDAPILQTKNSRNFVFAPISPTKGEQEEPKPELIPNKRKMSHLPLPIAKKPCVQKPKTANKKSLFEVLTKVHS